MDNNQQDRKSFYTIAFILMIVATCFWGWTLIGLAWCIPMTVMMKRARDEVGSPNEQSHIGLAVCTLLFVSIIAGIFAIIAACMMPSGNMNQGYNANNDNTFAPTNSNQNN